VHRDVWSSTDEHSAQRNENVECQILKEIRKQHQCTGSEPTGHWSNYTQTEKMLCLNCTRQCWTEPPTQTSIATITKWIIKECHWAFASLYLLCVCVRACVLARVLLAADSQSTSSSGYRASLWDPWPDFILLFFLRLTNYFILLSKAPSLTRKRVCSLQCNHSLVRTLLSHLRLCSLLSPVTTLKDYGGSILTRLHTECVCVYIFTGCGKLTSFFIWVYS
jgi:hypothetical protein